MKNIRRRRKATSAEAIARLADEGQDLGLAQESRRTKIAIPLKIPKPRQNPVRKKTKSHPIILEGSWWSKDILVAGRRVLIGPKWTQARFWRVLASGRGIWRALADDFRTWISEAWARGLLRTGKAPDR